VWLIYGASIADDVILLVYMWRSITGFVESLAIVDVELAVLSFIASISVVPILFTFVLLLVSSLKHLDPIRVSAETALAAVAGDALMWLFGDYTARILKGTRYGYNVSSFKTFVRAGAVYTSF